MNELSTTTHGRVLSIAIAVALIGGSVGGMIHDPMGIALMCASLLGGVVLSLMAIALSIETRPSFGVFAVVLLPFIFFMYAVGLQLSIYHHARWGMVGFIGLGALSLINALRGRPAEGHRAQVEAHAH